VAISLSAIASRGGLRGGNIGGGGGNIAPCEMLLVWFLRRGPDGELALMSSGASPLLGEESPPLLVAAVESLPLCVALISGGSRGVSHSDTDGEGAVGLMSNNA